MTKPRNQNRQPSADSAARTRLLAGAPGIERRLRLAGVSTMVTEAGDGPPVILLHGQGGIAGLWLPIIGALAETHRVIAPDLPGLGESEAPDGPPSPHAVQAWLAELIDQTCAQPPVLVGFSLGGQLAARFAARHSERIARLVLIDTPGLVGKPRPAPATLLALVRHNARPSERSTLRLFRQLTGDLDSMRTSFGERWESLVDYLTDRARTPSVRAANRRLLRDIGLQRIPPEELARITTDTTLVWGHDDRVTPLRTARQASEKYRWPLHVVEHAGHLVIAERPRAVLTALRTALGNHSTDESTS